MGASKCIRCGRFGAKPTRVVTLWTNDPIHTDDYGAYGEWWLVDKTGRYPEGFLRGIPCGPYPYFHAEHANSTFVIERTVMLCDECGKDGTYVLLYGAVSTCDSCGQKRYGAGGYFSHTCEDCLEPPDFDFTPCECLRPK